MIKADYIAANKKEGLVLIQHTVLTDKDGTPIYQYIPKGTLQSMQTHGWAIIADVPTPPESLPTEEEQEINEQPKQRGRKPKTA